MSAAGQRQNMQGCNFTNALLQRAPDDACKVWLVNFNANIHSQGGDYGEAWQDVVAFRQWEADAAKFSVGLGLFIYAIIKLVVPFSVEMMMAAPNETPHGNFCQRIELTYGIGAGPGVFFYNNPYICAAVSCFAPAHEFRSPGTCPASSFDLRPKGMPGSWRS